MDLAEQDAPDVDADVRREPAVDLSREVEGRAREGSPGVDLVEDAALEELPQRGDADHGGRARGAKPLGDALARHLADVHDARAARQRQQQPAGELEGVVQRQDAEHDVAAREREDGRERRDERGEVRVCELDALGPPGRSAREEDAREVVRGHPDGGRRERAVVAGDVVEIDDRQCLGRRDHTQPGADALVGHDDAHRRLRQDRRPRERVEGRVHRDHDGARTRDPEVRDGPVGVVGARERHAIALLHAERRETRRRRAGAPPHLLRPCGRPPRRDARPPPPRGGVRPRT